MMGAKRRRNDEICSGPMVNGFEWRGEARHDNVCARIGALTLDIGGLVFDSFV